MAETIKNEKYFNKWFVEGIVFNPQKVKLPIFFWFAIFVKLLLI